MKLGSLRVRITLAMLLLAAVGSSVFAFGIYLGAERLERSVLNRHVAAEFESFARDVARHPEIGTLKSALLLGFVGRDNPELPAEFAALEAGGYHAVRVGDKAYQVHVADAGGRRYYVGYDITEWEALERPVIGTLLLGVLLSSALAILLGLRISAQIIKPVTALSQRVRSLDPRARQLRIAPEFEGAEVSTIAEAFDRFMLRLDGFVERERLFTSAAAHELRTPLAVIQGATDVLGAQPDLPPAARRATARLERAIRDMREFIDALLLLSRESGTDSGEAGSTDVDEVIRQLVEDYGQLVGDRPVTLGIGTLERLALAAPPALPAIVISNLLRNAVEHTASGEIRVDLRGGKLTIADPGSGLDPAARERLFDRGYTTKAAGGLGLHLSKRICDQFGWQLALESAPGTGTTATVEFGPGRRTAT